MNRDLQAMMKKRRLEMGIVEEQPQKVPPKVEVKTQKSSNQAFSEARKNLQANLFKQNLPKQAPLKPKQQIKGNSESIKNAKALLQANLNFGGNKPTTVNSGGNLPPPPTLIMPTGGLPLPPTLPNFALLPPPPTLPTLPNFANLPLPPTLPNLPPPPKIGNLPPPPTLLPLPTLPNVNNLSPPPTLPNLPPPPTIQNIGVQKPQNLTPPPPNYLPPPVIKTQTQPSQKVPKTESIVGTNRNSSKISEQQFRNFEKNVKKESSVDKKKSIFGNEPMIGSKNQQKPDSQVNPYQSKTSTNPQIPQPIVLPSNNSKFQPEKKIQNNNMPPKSNESKQKRKIFQKQNSISLQFFGKDVAGFLKKQFLKNNDVLSYIDKKLPPPKTSLIPKYTFPSILQEKRGSKDEHPDPREMIYVDTKVLNVSGPFLVNNLNAIRDHNESRQAFDQKLKTYDLAKDPQKLQLRAIKQLAESIPSKEYYELNLARIYSCIRKCEALIKQKVALKMFQQCQQIEDLKKQLLKLTQKYCKYPQDCKDQPQTIDRVMNRVRDLDIN